MFSTAILVAGLAATASAHLRPGDIVMKRDLYARQTATGVYSDCLTALVSIYSGVPTPPPELLSFEATYSVTDPCSYSIPKSLESVFSSYESEVVSFYKDHSSEIESAVSECPQYSSYETDFNTETLSDVCATGGSGGGSTETGTAASTDATTTTDSGSGSSTTSSGSGSSGSSSSVSNNIGPRETGFAAAAVAAAGFLGAVIAL